MSKIVNVEKRALEVCRNCWGKGSDESTGEKCGICGGSGMVKKTWEITITIDPHLPNQNNRNNEKDSGGEK